MCLEEVLTFGLVGSPFYPSVLSNMFTKFYFFLRSGLMYLYVKKRIILPFLGLKLGATPPLSYHPFREKGRPPHNCLEWRSLPSHATPTCTCMRNGVVKRRCSDGTTISVCEYFTTHFSNKCYHTDFIFYLFWISRFDFCTNVFNNM